MAAIGSLQKAIACICFAQLFLLGTILPRAEAQIDCPSELVGGMFACAPSLQGAAPTPACCTAAIAANKANCFCLKATFNQFNQFGITDAKIATLATSCGVEVSAVKVYGNPACPAENAPAGAPSQLSALAAPPSNAKAPTTAPGPSAMRGAAPTVLARSLLQVTIGFATLFALALF